ncbi:MAG: MgtC/SapB family protein [Clostridia bacterium]|nr:MgtC/SapB family protein [Clostridia bacterium]
MAAIFEYLASLDVLWTALLRALLALFAGGVIGMERGKQGRAAGMRTHILVCLGSALTAMIGLFAVTELGTSGDPLRISAQVVSGIGFLGVGTILLKGRFQITGLTTAAGLWCAATIGLAIGVGYYAGAAVTFLSVVLAITILHRVEYKLTKRNTRFGIYAEIKSDKDVRKIVDFIEANFRSTDIQVTGPRSATTGNVGIEANIHAKNGETPDSIARALEELDEVVFALESI